MALDTSNLKVERIELKLDENVFTSIRAWPCGTWQYEDETPYSWKSDDYRLIPVLSLMIDEHEYDGSGLPDLSDVLRKADELYGTQYAEYLMFWLGNYLIYVLDHASTKIETCGNVEIIDVEEDTFTRLMAVEDARKGVASFLEQMVAHQELIYRQRELH